MIGVLIRVQITLQAFTKPLWGLVHVLLAIQNIVFAMLWVGWWFPRGFQSPGFLLEVSRPALVTLVVE